MVQGKLAQYLLALWRQRQKNLALIFFSTLPANVSASDQSIGQLDCAVVLNSQAFCQFSDARTRFFRQSFKRQHQLVLTRLEPNGARGLFTEVQELPNVLPQFRQDLVIAWRE